MTKKVKMKFNRDMYYTDKVKPKYLAGQVYEIDDEGKGMVNRWLKRGGVIVGEEQHVPNPNAAKPAPAPGPTPIAPPKPVEQPVKDEEKKTPTKPAKEEEKKPSSKK